MSNQFVPRSAVPPSKFCPLIDNEGVIYSSPTASGLPPSLPKYPPSSETGFDPIRNLRYLTNEDFYLAFVPQEIDLTGRLLDCLNFNQGSFPIKKYKGNYYLQYDVGRKWTALEHILGRTKTMLMRVLTMRTPPGFHVPMPSQCGYQRGWPTPQQARLAAWRAREAFIGFCALISFLIASCKTQHPPDLFWCHVMERLCGEDPTYLNLLSATPLFSDHSTKFKRTGVMIDVSSDLEWHTFLHIFIASDIPIWCRIAPYALGVPRHLNTRILQMAKPDGYQVDVLARKHIQRTLGPVPPLAQPVIPPPHPHSGQKYGQTWQEFFEARERANLRTRETAFAGEKQRWTSRRDLYDSPRGQVMPDTSSASPITYVWVSSEGSEEKGFLLRKLVNRASVGGYWKNRHPSERIYDPIGNTWDLCKPAGEGRPPEELTDGPDLYEADEDLGFTILDTTTEIRYDFGPIIGTELQALLPSSRSKETQERYHYLDSARDVLRTRYSFVEYDCVDYPTNPSRISRDVCLKTIVHREVNPSSGIPSREPRFPDSLETSMRDFITALSRDYALKDVPFYTLNPRLAPPNFQPQLLSTKNDLFRIRLHKYSRSSGWVDDREGFTYFINAKGVDHREHWDLFVDDPLTALQVIRSGWGPSLSNIAHELVLRGIPFNTFLYKPIINSTPKERDEWHQNMIPPSLGHSIKLNSVECYKNYVEARNTFLREHAHARTALRLGGIVWRLAIDVLDPELVLEGPCQYFEWTGRPWLVDDQEVWDDVLSLQELDLICGVSSIPTNQACTQFAQASWWPKHSTWKNSGLDIGYWTPQCELWFQNRRKVLQEMGAQVDGQGKLRKATEWSTALTFQNATKRLRHNARAHAHQFILQNSED